MAIILSEDNVRSLMDAGLTSLQAKVLLALLSIGKGSVHSISKFSGIDRSNVYKTIKDLEKLGLVEKELGTTTKYNTIPLPIAIPLLLNRKKQEYRNTLKNLQKLAKEADIFKHKKDDEFSEFFKIYPGGSEFFCRKWEKTLKSVKNSVDLIATENREIKDDPIWEIYVKLLEKCVDVRWIIDRSDRDDTEFFLRVKQFEHLFWYPNIKMRVCFDCLKPWGAIIDNKFVIIFLDEEPPVKCSRTLWTNNRPILLNFKEHFEITWKKATPYSVQ